MYWLSQVLEKVKSIASEGQEVTKLSVLGYSLGGLVSRYLIGILHQRKFFENVKPMNFVTVATPHIGLVKFPGFRSRMFAFLGPRLLSRTGEQFYAVDKWSVSGRPLLEVMADPGTLHAVSFFEQLNLHFQKCDSPYRRRVTRNYCSLIPGLDVVARSALHCAKMYEYPLHRG